MGSDGEKAPGVACDVVLKILRDAGVRVYDHPHCPGFTVLAKGEVVESHELPDIIGRHLLGRFAAKFSIQVSRFWEPQPDLGENVTDISSKRRPGKQAG